jgi:thiamine kinase-like enzyme
MNYLINIARQFVKKGKVVGVRELGDGNINQTFLVTVNTETNYHFVLQQINTQVFTQPELVMNNIQTLANHVNQKLSNSTIESNRRWQVPQVLFTSTNQNHYIDKYNNFWRAISYIDNARTYNTIQDLQHAQELGYGLGLFHKLMSDLDITQLADTLPGFHITPEYFKQYLIAKNNYKKISKEVKYCQQFIQERIEIIDILERAKARGFLKIRPIHGDPKINNIMIDREGKAIALIDLDTVKPGLIHYDLGDCIRSGCNSLGEETTNLQAVNFDLDLAKAILQGYLTVARDFITHQEVNYIYDSIRLITFELGLRFFTDYLNNNVYFKINYPEHNLSRALVQFQLVKSIESQVETIKKMVVELFKNSQEL